MMATLQIWGITAYIITLLIIIRPLGVTVTLKERSIQVWYAPSCGTTFNNWLLMHVISFLTLSLTFPALALTFLFLSCSCTQFHLILIPSSCLVHVLIHIPMWGKLRSLVRVSNIVSFLNKNKNSSALTFLANSWVHNYINN